MFERNRFTRKFKGGRKAQAIVEFAIALPILLFVLVGIFEVGRMVFIYSSVTNASRNAARYASAYGLSDGNYRKYLYCDGIKEVAINSSFLVVVDPADITISYDDGNVPSPGSLGSCTVTGGEQNSVFLNTGDRVTVQVSVWYRPMLRLLPLEPRLITSSSSRTILAVIDT